MWCQAGLAPGDFWEQTPATFQACMTGVRRRLEADAEDRLALSWHMAAFNAASKSKAGLKPLRYYLSGKADTPSDMLAMIRTMGSGTDMRIKRVKRG